MKDATSWHPEGLIDWLALKETKHRKMFRFCWKQNLSTCWRFLKCAAVKAIKEELRQDSLMLSKIPSWERSRIHSPTTLAESMVFRLLPFGGTSWLVRKLFLKARLRGNTVIRVIDSGSNPANQETGVVSASRDHPVCLVDEGICGPDSGF